MVDQSRQATVFYVAPDGSDNNAGTDDDLPFRTIGASLRHVRAGDTVLVMPGVYREGFDNPPGGTADQPVRIAAYDPDVRPILRPGPGARRVFTFASAASSYIEIDGFIMDAANVQYNVVKITGGAAAGGSHHIRIKNSELKNSPHSALLVNGHQHGVAYNEFSHLDIHDSGTSDLDHGIYLAAPFNIVEHSRIHHNAGWGIHNYGGDPSHNIYRHNHIFDNAAAGARGIGIGIYNGQGSKLHDNYVEGNQGGIVVSYGARDTEIERNVVRGNGFSFRVGTSARNTVFRSNIIEKNRHDSIQDGGVSTVLASNRINVNWRRGFLASTSPSLEEVLKNGDFNADGKVSFTELLALSARLKGLS